MELPSKSQAALFQVYLRLRPPPATSNQLYPSLSTPDRFLTVEEHTEDESPTHITLNPPNDNRRRAVEKFAFTRVFEEDSSQLDLFHGTGVLPLVEGVLGPHGGDGRDGLLATLGVTGSGKSHTILGSRNQRGLTQLALDVLFRSISSNILDVNTTSSLHATVAASDPSEAQVMSAQQFLDTFYNDPSAASRASSRAPTPMIVGPPSLHPTSKMLYPSMSALKVPDSPKSIRIVQPEDDDSFFQAEQEKKELLVAIPYIPSFMQSTAARARKYITKTPTKGESFHSSAAPTPQRRNLPQRPSVFPQLPDIGDVTVMADQSAEYAILISMYEVYNDRIFDLLTPASANKSTKEFRRRPLLFKPTEQSPDRKVVAGLRKIICGNMREALMVLEAGLHERRVAGTGSNSVSSRSHGFFCVEVKKRRRSRILVPWGGSALTIVDLAGSERARDAKTQGATLAEAGKINESLMYLGQCLQMQSDIGNSSKVASVSLPVSPGRQLTCFTKPNLVPFRQCKLTELLFSNSFPSASASSSASTHSRPQRNPQKATMIVTADPLGDFNATSQILRYSALAREITVPRIPSITSTILAPCSSSNYFSPPRTGRTVTPTDNERATMENAALQIALYIEEIEGLRQALEKEERRNLELEAHLESMSDKMLEVEQEVREECYGEMEGAMEREIARWKSRWQEEAERGEEHLDRKVEILTRGLGADDEGEDKENVFVGEEGGNAREEELEKENDKLRREVELLKRELGGRSPSKRMPLKPVHNGYKGMGESGVEEVEKAVQKLRFSDEGGNGAGDRDRGEGTSRASTQSQNASPTKKIRKLAARKWDLLDEGDML